MESGTESSFTPYYHTPFEDETSIRLLHLQPGDFEDDIHIELGVTPLSDPQVYETLSYVWGPKPHQTPVHCDGKEILVSRNCIAALRRLREMQSDQKIKVLWIDAICIDQTSLTEREHQVKLMDEVYSKSQRTWIWLGESTPLSDIMMDFLGNYHPWTLRKFFYDNRETMTDEEMEEPVAQQQKYNSYIEKEQAMTGAQSERLLGSLCRRPWFTRVWTVQEYTLSRDPHVLCGSKVLPIENLLEGALVIINRRQESGEPTYRPFTESFGAYYQYRAIWAAIHASGSKTISFTRMLIEGRKHKASDPKDVVYGLNAVLLHGPTVYSTYKLPSWVLDWSVDDYNVLYPSISKADNFNASNDSLVSFSFACRHDLTKVPILLSVKGVIIDTIRWCGPEACSQETQNFDAETLPVDIVRPRKEVTIIESIEAGLAQASKLSPYPTGETILQAYSRTLILDVYRSPDAQLVHPGFDAGKGLSHLIHSYRLGYRLGSTHSDEEIIEGSEITSKAFREEFWEELGLDSAAPVETDMSETVELILDKGVNARAFEGSASANRPTILGQEDAELTITDAAQFVQISLERSANALKFQYFASSCVIETAFFTTEKGYMGKGLRSIRAGDQIVLVQGLSRPLIVRCTGLAGEHVRYRTLGPAYVHGIMEGEMWPEDERVLVDIVIE
ncbi:hypothetical protein VTL71DRAFT_9690 [Oculimacula yallundae]|uniref:Heterokaryon incompatibility domain-containing protein n=1 Tax=Oculimacula yallundae TaxID=86028 RepID=A0ABR4BRK9_9HELO